MFRSVRRGAIPDVVRTSLAPACAAHTTAAAFLPWQVHQLLDERSQADAMAAREEDAVEMYRLLSEPPPRGTPCFDADEMGATCAICLEAYDEADASASKAQLALLPGSHLALRRCGLGCGHRLHVRCTEHLIRLSPAGARCPLCREPLVRAGGWQRGRTRRDAFANFFA